MRLLISKINMTQPRDLSALRHLSPHPAKPRHKTREVRVGDKVVGGSNPVWVQSMTTTDTFDVEATVAQIKRLEEAGCELVRVTVPKPEDARVLTEIKKRIGIPLICDIHFDYKMALMALDHPVDKIRINPGNIGGSDRFRQVVRKAKDRGLPMRIGVNAGSLERELVEQYGFPCPPAMVESAIRYIEMAEKEGYHDMIVSLKSSDVLTVVEAYRLFAKYCDYPTHIGVTEAGKPPYAVTKSASGLAPILLDGIGDTIRISLPGQPRAGNRRSVRHSPGDAAARAQAGADRLPDLRAPGHRPGEDHRRPGEATRRQEDAGED